MKTVINVPLKLIPRMTSFVYDIGRSRPKMIKATMISLFLVRVRVGCNVARILVKPGVNLFRRHSVEVYLPLLVADNVRLLVLARASWSEPMKMTRTLRAITPGVARTWQPRRWLDRTPVRKVWGACLASSRPHS